MNESRCNNVGFLVLRVGLAFVFLWFGFSQLRDPLSWTGYLPEFLNGGAISGAHIVLLNGWFEILGAILLTLGIFVRPIALLLSLHLLGISMSIGINSAVGIRDVGLAVATLVVAIVGAGGFSLEDVLKKEQPLA